MEIKQQSARDNKKENQISWKLRKKNMYTTITWLFTKYQNKPWFYMKHRNRASTKGLSFVFVKEFQGGDFQNTACLPLHFLFLS